MLNFIDKSFSARKTTQYRLSIQVDLDGFSFSVYDLVQQKHVVLKQFADDFSIECDLVVEKIRHIYKKVEWLNKDFSRCLCIFTSPKNTLIPISYFSQERLRSFLNFVSPLDELDEIHYKTLDKVDVAAVFAIPNPIAAELNMRHKRITFYNQSVPLIHHLLKKKDGEHLCINVNGSIADLAIMRDGGLLYHNSFEIKAAYDLLYYVSFVLQQLGIEPTRLAASFSGKLNAEMQQQLGAYLPKLGAEKGAVLPIASENMVIYHQLLTLHECES